MKRIIQLFIISALFLVAAISDLTAREVSGSLSSGEGSSFVPSQGSAFSIISDVTSGIYGGNFNILIKSGGRIIYKENNQLDDLYLVFNEPVDAGDIIKLDVVKGLFIFKMSHMDTLPDVIVDAIKKQAPKEYKQLKPLHKPRKKKKLIKKKPVKKSVIPKKVTPAYDSRVIKRHIKPEDYTPAVVEKQPEIVISKPEPKPVKSKPIPMDIAKPIAGENIIKPITQKSGIDNLSNSIDSVNKEIASVIKSQSKVIDSRVTRNGIEEISRDSKVKAPKTSTSSIESLPIAKTFPQDFDTSKSPIGFKSTIPKSQTEMESFSTSTPPTMRENQTGSFQTQISTSAVQKPEFRTEPKVVVKKIKIQEPMPKPQMEEVFKVNPAPKHEPEIVKYDEPQVVAPEPVAKIIEPEIVKAPIVKREESKDRIVITKTIAIPKKKKEVAKEEPRVIKRHVQPKEYKTEQEQIPGRMSDRVAGNGYGMSTQGKIKVKAYSNNRPVSAWVEVFKAGTSQRVKTFYTGKGGSLKDVKLPAGTYVIKATYRTATSKRKKTLGRVVLEEGGSINKKISFDDGTVTIKVKKSDKPIYAKVEVYKSGSKRRIAYEFTSKSNGVAKLSLGSGEYDIVIKDHSEVIRFDSVRVKGGKSKTLNADF